MVFSVGSKEGTSSTSIFQASKVRRWKAEEEGHYFLLIRLIIQFWLSDENFEGTYVDLLYMNAEVEQGKAKGKGEQHGVV